MDSLKSAVEFVKSRTKVNVNERDIEKVIAALNSTNHFWEVIFLSQKPFAVVRETINYLISIDFVKSDENGNLQLTQKGKEFVKQNNIPAVKNYTCQYCEGRGIVFTEIKDAYEKFKQIVKTRPEAIVEYDQGYVTEETAFSRIAMMIKKGDLVKKRLIVFGDDDLVSIAAALTELPAEVVVLEIDKRLVDFINQAAKEYNLNLKAIEYDFRNKLPDEFVKSFDTFTIDPPETIEALDVCFTRTMSSLKGAGGAGYFGLTNIEASLSKWHEFQKLLLNKFNAVITDIIENFNHYVNWNYLLPSLESNLDFVNVQPRLNWYTSSMYRIELVKDIEIPNEYINCELYIDNEAILYKE
ncbi:bis-aminopropyl spermidine synthase family protein [Caldicellulosiruptor morganii]|uniref:N(4)-bis(aminopropyl)spermidine synthase n=1 Tax=Caldicellulosiruptor morganii TaxID=1387555 RepID=A0ABY7BM59_9FIRM|nr:bis-aminopropyl spermidine synthase family protein [Caldicellulosiruptor morganii]WAM33493.1 bis-aminopropyl spermidine synthase family protein [Caldicellulosiruptor morganii]